MPDPQSSIPMMAPMDPLSLERAEERAYIMDCVNKSDAYKSRFVDAWDEMLSNYLVSFDNNSHPEYFWNSRGLPNLSGPLVTPGRLNYQGLEGSRLKDPETHQIVETLAAQGISLIFGSREYLKAVPIGSDDPEKARFLSRLIMSVMEGPGVFRTLYQSFKDAFIFGTAILEVGWEAPTRMQVYSRPSFDPMTGQASSQGQVNYRMGPSVRGVDIYDFYPDPNGTRIQEDMEWVVKRFRVSKSQARALAQRGTYDSEAVEKAIRSSETANTRGKANTRERFPQLDKTAPDKYGLLDGFEFWGRVPWQPIDGADNRVITLLGDQIVRSHINPFIDGNIPFKEIALNPINGRFYGLSPAEVIRYLQDSADNLLMVFNDSANLAANIPLLMGGAFGGDPKRLRARAPRDIIPCANPAAVAPVPIDTTALQFAAQDMQRRKQSMREASGATNPLQAIPTSDRQTATEVSELVRLASQRVELMVRVIEMDDFPWLGKTLHSRLRQFAPPQFVATLSGEQFPVSLDMIDMEADVRFVGSRHAKSQLQINQTYDNFLTILSTAPELVMTYPELVVRKLRDGLGLEDAQQLVFYAQQQLTMKMLAEQMTMGAAANEQEAKMQEKGKPSAPKQPASAESA